MIEIDPSRFRLPPFFHQLVGTKELVKNKNFAIFDEMGAGKTKQAIDAACILYEAGEIDTLLIVCPAQVKTVWLDPELGEIVKHSWVPVYLAEYSSKYPTVDFNQGKGRLTVLVVSYEFLRQNVRLMNLIRMIKANRRKVTMVLDESIFVKNPKAAQSKACFELRKSVSRAVLLNGTPISNNPLDLYAQFACLDKKILGFNNFYAFRNHHARMGGYLGKQVVGFVNLPELQEKLKPYVLRRLKVDCLDLPPKLPTHIEIALSPATWKIYKDMRDDMVAWLSDESMATASQAAVKTLRLSQITSGFLGGLHDASVDDDPDSLFNPDLINKILPPKEIGDEKLKMLTDWLIERFENDPAFRVVIWCRFRAELTRYYERFVKMFPKVIVKKIQGGQSKTARDDAKAEFQAGDITKPAILLGNPQAGGFGLTLTTAHTVVYSSNDYNLLTRLQSEDRVHRPGQTHPVLYVDIIATGPSRQKTVDHMIVKALQKKEDLSKLTTEEWRSRLMEE
jgi:SNF2 family DNA or RNA helicase